MLAVDMGIDQLVDQVAVGSATTALLAMKTVRIGVVRIEEGLYLTLLRTVLG